MGVLATLRALVPRPQMWRVKRWQAADGPRAILEHGLRPGDVVVEVGGYLGQWASDVYAMQRCRIVTFEPVPRFAAELRRRFARNPDVEVREAAVGAAPGRMSLSATGDAASAFSGRRDVEVPVLSIHDVVAQEGPIALLCLNCEGGEYDILEALLDDPLLEQVGAILVQFHLVAPHARERRRRLVARLDKEFTRTLSHPFVWEGWRRA